jgi:hypothetical protein
MARILVLYTFMDILESYRQHEGSLATGHSGLIGFPLLNDDNVLKYYDTPLFHKIGHLRFIVACVQTDQQRRVKCAS